MSVRRTVICVLFSLYTYFIDYVFIILHSPTAISMLEVEEEISSHPDVKACAAFSAEHEYLGERCLVAPSKWVPPVPRFHHGC
jgi:hypothetical protein